MLAWLKRAITPAPSIPKTPTLQSAGILAENIPRYPPFMKGLPVVSPEKLVQTQQELLSQVANTVVVNKLLFEKHYLGAITRFAAYAHLLPASQSHHHRGAGGLLRHSIEVGLWALQAGDKMLLDIGKTPSQRRELEPRWQLAAFLCGLCHDAGKPATDLIVSSHDRTKVWKPITENLSDWAQKNGVDAYFLDWRNGRSKQHIALSNLIADRIISTESLAWIEEGGTELIVWLMEALNGNPGATNPLYDLVLKADQASVERDLKSMGVAMAGYDLGVPVERHLADIMRRLIKEGIWQINEPGARVWNVGGNIYLVWPAAGDEIARQVKDDGIPGMPRTADGVLDMLVERQLAFVNEHSETGGRCWKLAPAILAAKIPDIALAVIRLRDDALISSSPIPQVEGRVFGGEVINQETGEITSAAAASSVPPAAAETQHPAPPQESPPPNPAPAQPQPAASLAPPPLPERQEQPAKPRQPLFPSSGSEPHHEPPREQTPKLSNTAPTARSAPSDGPRAQSKPRLKSGPPAKKKVEAPTLVFDGATGEALKAMADDLRSGTKQWSETVHVDSEGYAFLRWPGAFTGYGLTAKVLLDELSSKEWIWIDPMMPLRKVLEIEIDGLPHKAIRLESEASHALLYAAGHESYGGAKTSAKPVTAKEPSIIPEEPMPTPEPAPIAPAEQPRKQRQGPPPPLFGAAPTQPSANQAPTQKPKQPRSEASATKQPAQNKPANPDGTETAARKTTDKKGESATKPDSSSEAAQLPPVAEIIAALAGLGGDSGVPGWRVLILQDARQAMKKAGITIKRAQVHALAKKHPNQLKLDRGKLLYIEK
jgi:conjugal transfer pilus assembly protein TraI